MKLYTDASDKGIGAVLSHVFPNNDEKPVCFISRTFSKAENNYAVIHKEALAIFWAVKKLQQYLLGHKFTLCTDHKPILALLGEKKGIPVMAAGRLQRWAVFLSEYNYEMKYIPGPPNMADLLSRLPLKNREVRMEQDKSTFNFIEEGLPIKFEHIRERTRRDPLLEKVVTYLESSWPAEIPSQLKPFYLKKQELYLNKGVVMWGYRVIIPEALQPQLMKELHSTHMEISKMKEKARAFFWWPKLDEHIVKWAPRRRVTK